MISFIIFNHCVVLSIVLLDDGFFSSLALVPFYVKTTKQANACHVDVRKHHIIICFAFSLYVFPPNVGMTSDVLKIIKQTNACHVDVRKHHIIICFAFSLYVFPPNVGMTSDVLKIIKQTNACHVDEGNITLSFTLCGFTNTCDLLALE